MPLDQAIDSGKRCLEAHIEKGACEACLAIGEQLEFHADIDSFYAIGRFHGASDRSISMPGPSFSWFDTRVVHDAAGPG